MSEQENLCGGCEEQIHEDGDGSRWSESTGMEFCWGCFESDINSASTVSHFPVGSSEHKVLVATNWVVDGEYYEDLKQKDAIKYRRTYHRTDGWRGYWVTEVDGYSEVADAVNLWGEGSKIDSLAERLKSGYEEGSLPFEFAFVVDLTSNVFTSGVSVVVKDADLPLFHEWVGEVH